MQYILVFLDRYLHIFMHSLRICFFESRQRSRVKFPPAKKEIDGVDRNETRDFLFHFLSEAARNAEHVASTSVYTQVHVISFRQSDRASGRSRRAD